MSHKSRHRGRSIVTRRRFLKTGVASASVVTIAGCIGDDNGAAAEGEEIHIVSKETSEEARQFYDELAQEFMEETGISVTMDYTSLSPVEHISTLIQTGNVPELATADSGQVGEMMARGLLDDVSGLLDTFESEYNDSIPEGVKIQNDDGEDMLLPLYANPTQVWFWADAYEEYGLDTSPGLTWDEYLEIAEEIDRHGDMRGTVVPSASTMLSGFKFWNFLFSNDGQVCHRVDGEVDIAFDKDDYRNRAVETVEFLNQLHQFSPEASDHGWGDILDDYVGQTAGHCIYGPRAKLQVIANRPDLRDESRPHFPVEGRGESFVSNQDGFVLFEDAENKDAAREFLEFLARENRFIDLLTSVAAVHNFPTMTNIAEMDEYREAEFIAENFREEDLDVISESFERGKSIVAETEPLNPYAPGLWSAREIGTMMYNVNIEGKDPEVAIDDTAARLREALEDLRDE